MFSRAGETYEGGDTGKCPGEAACDDWRQPWEPSGQWTAASGQTEAEWRHDLKEQSICRGCPMFASKALAMGGEAGDDEELSSEVEAVEDFVIWQNAGVPVDWDAYSFEFIQLVTVWREAEAVVEENRRRRFDALVKGFLK